MSSRLIFWLNKKLVYYLELVFCLNRLWSKLSWRTWWKHTASNKNILIHHSEHFVYTHQLKKIFICEDNIIEIIYLWSIFCFYKCEAFFILQTKINFFWDKRVIRLKMTKLGQNINLYQMLWFYSFDVNCVIYRPVILSDLVVQLAWNFH